MSASNNNSPYKPSPLSFGSPRTSPFRKPSAASSPTSLTARASRPASPSSKGQTPNQLHTTEDGDGDVFSSSPSARKAQDAKPFSPAAATASGPTQERPAVSSDTLGKLPPAQLREMREAFQILDRDNDGQVNRDDIVHMLENLGQDPSSSATTAYFPPGDSQTISLPTYLNKIAAVLAPLSSSQELLSAFAAFDEEDSGQVDLAELRDTLLQTSPDSHEAPLTEREVDEAISGFAGKRAFGGRGAKSGGTRNRGEVFRYQEFVGSITGGQGGNGRANNEPVEASEG